MDEFSRKMKMFENLLDDDFDLFDDDDLPPDVPMNVPPYTFSKRDTGLDLNVVSLTDPAGESDARKQIMKLNRLGDEIYDVIRLDVSDIPDKKTSEKIIFKDTECKITRIPAAVVINESDADVLNVGISYMSGYYYLDGDTDLYPVDMMFAVDDSVYRMFDTYENVYDKYNAILQYHKLTASQRKFFRNQFNRPRISENTDDAIFTPIRDEKALRVLYETCKDTYSDSTRARAMTLFSELGGHMNYGERSDAVNQLSHMLGIDTQVHPYKKKTFDEIMALMDEYIYGLDEFKESFAEFLLAMQYAGSTNFSALLVGPPGVGKTSIGKVIAKCCDKPFIHIDCSGADVIAMSGLVKSYSGAKAGKVIDSLWEIGRADAVIMFDEIDKLSVTKEGNPYSVFLKALGPQKLLRDEYVDADIDVSSTIFIATANNPEDIPGYVINRFGDNIFYLDKYSDEEKTEIARLHLVRSILRQHNIDETELKFTEEALMYIAREYCEDEGVREMEGYLKSLVRKVIRLWSSHPEEKNIVVDEDFVRKHLKKKSSNKKSEFRMGF